MKDLVIRILSALVGLILFFAVVFADGLVFEVALGVVILFMLFELFNAFKFKPLLTLSGLAGSLMLLFSIYYANYALLMFVLVLYIALLAIISVLCHGKISIVDAFTMLFCTLYITLFISYIGRAREIDSYGLYYMLLIFACAWLSDTGAYFAGKFFGKHKLIPQISPKKTVEGSIGGIVAAIISCIVIGVIAQVVTDTTPKYLLLVLIGFIGSCLAQIGDLVASLIKRTCGVKDFGNIMPGHGGILDRFDSVIFLSPFIYFVSAYFISIGFPIF